MRRTAKLNGTTYRGTWRLASLSVCLVLAIVWPALAQPDRAPLPDAATQRNMATLLDEIFGLSKLESTSKKQQAIKKLLELTRDDNVPLDERYVALTTLLKLTRETSDFAAWRETMDRLGTTFDIDLAKETTQSLKSFLESAASSTAFRGKSMDDIVEVIQGVANANRFEDAKSLLSAADAATVRVNATSAIKQAVAKARESVIDRETAWKQFDAASKKLASNPVDSAANYTVGRWQAVYQSDWDGAIPLLLKSDNVKWKRGADLEQKALIVTTLQVAAGDAWWDLAIAETGAAKSALMLRAGHWYSLASPSLTAGVQKQIVAKRLAEIDTLEVVVSRKTDVVTKPSPPQSTAPETPKTSTGWVDLLQWSEGVEWAPRGENWNTNLAGPASKNGITLLAQKGGKFPLPATIDGNYEMELEFTRTEGKDSVSVFFPVGIHNMHFECSGDAGTRSGVHFIDGKNGFRNDSPATRSPSPLQNGVRHRLLFNVKRINDQAEFQIGLDNEPNWIKWKGPYSSLTNVEESTIWKLPTTRHPWIGSWESRVEFHKIRVRMLSGTLRRDAITEADRQQDLKEGFVRLVGQPAIKPQVGWARFTVNQVPHFLEPGETERSWPLVTRDPTPCLDYYGAHAPSRLKCPIPNGAKSFSAIAYNHSSRTTRYQVLINGTKVYDSGVTDIVTVKVAIPPKSNLLELVVESDGPDTFDNSYWCYPRYHAVSQERITDAMLTGKSSPLKFTVSSHVVGPRGKFTHNAATNDVPLAAPLNFRDAVPCDEFLFAGASSSVSYEIPAGMKRFTAVGYNVRSDDVKYEVWTDGRKLMETPQAGVVLIDVALPAGAKLLELKVDNLKWSAHDSSMWCFPRLHKK